MQVVLVLVCASDYILIQITPHSLNMLPLRYSEYHWNHLYSRLLHWTWGISEGTVLHECMVIVCITAWFDWLHYCMVCITGLTGLYYWFALLVCITGLTGCITGLHYWFNWLHYWFDYFFFRFPFIEPPSMSSIETSVTFLREQVSISIYCLLHMYIMQQLQDECTVLYFMFHRVPLLVRKG